MKKLLSLLSLVLLFFIFKGTSYATYDPLSLKNNIYGIHILYPEEVSEAAALVNSSGGDWGYVTIPIMASDRDLTKWQIFMDNCRQNHLIPIIRLATTGDYFVQGSWSTPSKYDIIDFANFLNSLNWPTKNRYVAVYNEPNRGDEWGGTPDPADYAQILDYAVQTFKQRNSDFFIISAGLDNASANIPGKSMDEFEYMYEMNSAVPGIFDKIDGLGSHSYPNPGFSAPPSLLRMGIDSFDYQNNLVEALAGKKLPVFITETGWTDSISYSKQIEYYKTAFNDYWTKGNVVAVTPFILRSEQGPFLQFSFIKNGEKTDLYKAYKGFSKTKGTPLLTPNYKPIPIPNKHLPLEKFKPVVEIKTVFEDVNKSSKSFFKWLLKFD